MTTNTLDAGEQVDVYSKMIGFYIALAHSTYTYRLALVARLTQMTLALAI
jgi:hypothetical protein